MRISFVLILAAALGISTAFAKQDQSTVSSSDKTITYGESFTPDYYGGDGSGNWQFCIGGYTNWTMADNGPAGTCLPNGQWTTSWDVPAAGSYGFYMGKCGDNDWNMSNLAGWYTLTVNRASQPNVWSADATIEEGNSFSPDFMGGADGAGNWQFCIGGYTNWNMADNGPGGTQLPNGQWSGNWTPPGPGTYGFYIGKCGNNNWLGSNYAGWYTLTVTAHAKSPQSPDVSISQSPSYIYVGDNVTFNASGGCGSGGYVWSGDASGTGSSTSVTFSSAGSHSVSAYRQGDNNYLDSNTATASFDVHKRSQSSVSISPSSQTINVGESITFSASGGDGSGGYNWGGSASGGGSTNTVTFSSSGSFDVTVYRSGDSTYEDSGTTTVTITVNLLGQSTVSISPSSQTIYVGQSLTFTASGGSGNGQYSWSGDTNGYGVSKTVTFSTLGMHYVYVYRQGDGTYADSNTATAAISVINVPQSPPVITSSTSASGTVGTAFSNYYITATNSPSSYGASGLPAGLSVNTGSGLISGTPTTAGTYNATISASNSGGTGYATLTITVTAGSQSDTQNQDQLNIHVPTL